MTTQETQSDNTRDNAPFAGHTPGPWRTSHPFTIEGQPRCIDVVTDTDLVAEIRLMWAVDDRTQEANARLIAAAPSLLAVNAQLIAALGRIADIEAGPLDPREDSLWRSDIARAALSAARALEGHGNAGTSA